MENKTPLEPVDALFANEMGGEILLSSLIEAIDAAADDDRITSLVLDLEDLAGPSTSQSMEIIEALERFSVSGKPIVALGDYFSQSLPTRFAGRRNHPPSRGRCESDGLWCLSHLPQAFGQYPRQLPRFRAGENKSAVEPYLRDDMSPPERVVVGRWINSLWDDYTAQVESGRGKRSGEVTEFVVISLQGWKLTG